MTESTPPPSIANTEAWIYYQERLRGIALSDGHGVVKRSAHGAFIVFARASPEAVLKEIQKVHSYVESLREMTVVFLAGPTPRFFGSVEERASTSWRREFLLYIDGQPQMNGSFLIVVPEPEQCDWGQVDFAGLSSVQDNTYAQLHWEAHYIFLASQYGTLVLHSHFRWAGNAGPTARCEAGHLFALMANGKLRSGVVNCAPDSQTTQYIEAHLADALMLLRAGLFVTTACSPLLAPNESLPAGTHTDGSSDLGALDLFFAAICETAIAACKQQLRDPVARYH